VAKYHTERIEIRHVFVPGNNTSWLIDNIFSIQAPLQLFIGFVDTLAYAGTRTTDPYYFHHHDVRRIGLKLDNLYWKDPIRIPSWEGTDYYDAYFDFLRSLRVLNTPTEVFFSPYLLTYLLTLIL
jgi:hypothetical protein